MNRTIEGLTEEERKILDSDFPKEPEYNRETINKYSKHSRDVGIATGRWYTPREMEERGKKAFSVKL